MKKCFKLEEIEEKIKIKKLSILRQYEFIENNLKKLEVHLRFLYDLNEIFIKYYRDLEKHIND